MGYKIFFAYQSDSDDKFNKGFIHQASLNAILKLKEEGFDVEFDYGFKKTPGTPILIEEMLKKNNEADMVLVDLTLTSSSKGFNSKDFTLLGQTVSLHKEKKNKLSPNPNVLLETGYAWSSKGFYRTLAIMNTAYGLPTDLPVDFDGFRWGITYSLNQDNYSDRKSVRKKLVKGLYEAFKSSLISEVSYQMKKWQPLIVGDQWRKYHTYPYTLVESLKDEFKRFRELLNVRDDLRITGLKGCGKTRFVLEALDNNEEIGFDSLAEQILYHDYEGATAGDVSKQISELRHLNQHKIFIADNCSFDKHKKLRKEFKSTNVKLISIKSIENSRDTDNANIFIDNKITTDIFREIVKEKFGAEKVPEITGHFNLDLEEFIERVMDGFHNEDIKVSNIDYLKLLLGKDWIEKKALKFLIAIAFFKQIGVSGSYKNEINFIRETFVECNQNELDKLKEFLESKRFIKPKGDFIVLNRYEDELKEYGIKQSIDNIELVVKGVSKYGLWLRFKQTFFELLEKNPSLVDTLNSDQGLLNTNEFVDSEEGSKFLNLLADKYPRIVLDKITKKVESNDRGI